MRLEGITAIRAKDDGPSAGLEYADHLTYRGTVILYVFDHFMAEDQVKRRGGKRDEFPGSIENVWRIDPCFDGALEVVFQSNNSSTEGGEVFDVHADAASVFEDIPLDAFTSGMDDHVEPALLSRPPYIGRFTAQSGFIEVSLIHGDNYILHLLLPRAKILAHVELITEHTEKWAPPTFLLVIRSIRSNWHG
jgi:hypothetical protein